jgi:hypothetical protein
MPNVRSKGNGKWTQLADFFFRIFLSSCSFGVSITHSVIFMFCWPRISKYACNETNAMQYSIFSLLNHYASVCFEHASNPSSGGSNVQGDQKSLCTWWLQYRKLQITFKVSPASLQIFIDTPNCFLEARVQYSTVHIPNVFCDGHLFFCVFLYCNHQVHRDFLITLYICDNW